MTRFGIVWSLMVCCFLFSCTSRSTTKIEPGETVQVEEDRLITRSVTLKHILAKEMAQALAFMLSPDGQIAVSPEPDIETSKTLIIIDQPSTVEHISDAIKKTDVPYKADEGTKEDSNAVLKNNAANFSLPPKPSDEFVESVEAPADNAGRRKYVYRVRHSTANALKFTLADVYQKGSYQEDEFPPIFVESDPDMNAIIIAATPSQFAEIKALLTKIDIQPMQMSLDVLIAEVDLTEQEELGINQTLATQGQVTIGGETNSIETETFSGSSEIESLTDGLSYTIGSAGRFMAVLKALLVENRIRVLSKPRILVRNNIQATINIGEEIPISQVSEEEGEKVTSYQMQEIALVLKVTPRINPDGTIRLDINQTVSEIGIPNYQNTGVPSVNKRVANTSLVVQDGMSIFIGGLLSEKKEHSEKGIPVLKDLPLLGRLFRYSATQTRRRELFLVLTAHIMWTPEHEASYTRAIREDIKWWLNEEPFIETDTQKIKRLLRGIGGRK